jgi:hypothetical protein
VRDSLDNEVSIALGRVGYFYQRRSGIGFEFVQEDDDGPIDSRRDGSLPRVDKLADGTDDTASENNL